MRLIDTRNHARMLLRNTRLKSFQINKSTKNQTMHSRFSSKL